MRLPSAMGSTAAIELTSTHLRGNVSTAARWTACRRYALYEKARRCANTDELQGMMSLNDFITPMISQNRRFLQENERKNKNALLEHIKNAPEWQSALIYEQLAALNKAAADISTGTSTLEQGFADGKLRPDRYYCSDRVFRRDCNTGVLDSIASALGRALAALEVLSALSDAFQREYLSSVEISQGIYYNELEKLCLRHGYTKEDNT